MNTSIDSANAPSPRIHFKNLEGFPEKSDKIETCKFLASSKEIVGVIETFGRIFTPVTKDMNGNIKKLTSTYEKDKENFHYLEDLIVLNAKVDNNYAASAVLWLKRALELICQFFENISNDDYNSEPLKQHLQDAYNRTLKPYHGWLVQNTVTLIYRWVPSRSQLLGTGAVHDENIRVLNVFLPKMRCHLDRLDALLKEHNLDEASKS